MTSDIQNKTNVTIADGGRSSELGVPKKIARLAAAIGPGVFIIGYIIGTGSVTTMASAGASYGMSMTWALALSCLFTYVMIVSISRLTIASGQTIIYCIRQQFGSVIAVLIILGLMLTVITSVMGITAIASDVFQEWSRAFTLGNNGIHPILSTTLFIALLYYLFWVGKHKFFLKAMSVVVAIMGICFITSMLLVVPSMADIAAGLVPRMPTNANASLILAGLVGTTMAGVCVIARSYLVAEQGWNLNDVKIENRDAIISLGLTFVVSAAIMACAAGTLFPRGIPVQNAIDMVATLQPIAGRFASSIFVFGVMAAALSSLFAGYVLGPWLICDYLNVPRKMDRPIIRVSVLMLAIIGFTVPVFGGRPVIIMIASQAISPILMPLLVVLVLIMLNKQNVIHSYENPLWLNIGLIVTFMFSLFMSYASFVGLFDFITHLLRH